MQNGIQAKTCAAIGTAARSRAVVSLCSSAACDECTAQMRCVKEICAAEMKERDDGRPSTDNMQTLARASIHHQERSMHFAQCKCTHHYAWAVLRLCCCVLAVHPSERTRATGSAHTAVRHSGATHCHTSPLQLPPLPHSSSTLSHSPHPFRHHGRLQTPLTCNGRAGPIDLCTAVCTRHSHRPERTSLPLCRCAWVDERTR